MEKFINVLLNPSKTIRHVHCCASAESGKHFRLKKGILDLNKHKGGKDCLVVAATCKYATSLTLLLQDLGDGIAKKDACKNIDTFMDSLMTAAMNQERKRVILAVFASESLHNIGVTALTAFLSIPSANSDFRILTVSDTPWGFSEHTEAAGGCRPVEVMLYDSAESIVKQLVATVVEQTGLDEVLVNLVVQSVSEHILDARLISKICLEAHRLAENSGSEKERIAVITREVRQIMNELEARVVLKHNINNKEDDFLEMPVLDQLLLLASFCATHNSSTSDKRFFVKHHGKEKRNENRERAVELAAEQKENGPKAADVQRITFIFQVFQQQIQQDFEKNKKTKIGVFDPLPQLASLENTSQASRSSSYANIDQPKIKCMISNETAKKIARHFGLDLKDFLERQVATM